MRKHQLKSEKISITYKNFDFDANAHDSLRAHVVNLPSKSEIISVYAELEEQFRNDSDGTVGPMYLTVRSNKNQCDPIDPFPKPEGAGTLPWDFSALSNFRNDSEVHVPTLLGRNILCDYKNNVSVFISFQKSQETGGFMKGSMNVYLNYVSLDD